MSREGNRSGRLLLLGLPSLLLLGAAAGCASSRGAAPVAAIPDSPVEGRQEIRRLSQDIASYRQALGLPARADDDQQVSRAPAPPAAASEEGRDEADLFFSEKEVARPLAPSPQAAPSPRRAAERDSCPQPCRLTRAICSAAQRICRIAGYLGDADAGGRCRRASDDCEEAQRATEGQCEACEE